MSWDVTLFRFDRVYQSLEEMADCTGPVPMGTQAMVRAAIDEVFPGTRWEAPQDYGLWASWRCPDGSIEFDIGDDEEQVTSVGLHVRAGDAVVVGIIALGERLGCQVLDYSTGEFLTAASPDPARGLRGWREYRDRVMAGLNAAG